MSMEDSFKVGDYVRALKHPAGVPGDRKGDVGKIEQLDGELALVRFDSTDVIWFQLKYLEHRHSKKILTIVDFTIIKLPSVCSVENDGKQVYHLETKPANVWKVPFSLRWKADVYQGNKVHSFDAFRKVIDECCENWHLQDVICNSAGMNGFIICELRKYARE